MANKTCKKCNQTKPLSEFYKTNRKYYAYGRDYYCKYCRVGTHLTSISNNSKFCTLDNCEKHHYAKGYCRMHYARVARNGTTERLIGISDPSSPNRKRQLKKNYNITSEEYIRLSKNGCMVCGTKTKINLHMDHDHNCCNDTKSCGECIRGVVCHKCNVALGKMDNGLLRADYPGYEQIQQYLEAYNDRNDK